MPSFIVPDRIPGLQAGGTCRPENLDLFMFLRHGDGWQSSSRHVPVQASSIVTATANSTSPLMSAAGPAGIRLTPPGKAPAQFRSGTSNEAGIIINTVGDIKHCPFKVKGRI